MVFPVRAAPVVAAPSRHRRSLDHRRAPARRSVAAGVPPPATDVYAERSTGHLRAAPGPTAPQGELPARASGELSRRADRRVAERGPWPTRPAVSLRAPKAPRRAPGRPI